MNWIQIQNSNFTIEDNSKFIYKPFKDIGDINIHANDVYNKYTAILRSSEYFESGSIKFKFRLKDHDTFLNLSIGDYSLSVSLNSSTTKKAFALRKKNSDSEVEILAQTVEKGSLLINHEYNLKLVLLGSIIKVFLDEVLLFKETIKVPRSQVQFSARSKNEVIIHDFKIEAKRPRVFVVMQFSDEFNQLYKQVVKPVCESYGYECLRGDEYFTTGSILKDITDAIIESSIIIADITPNNPNVFYEVGYAHAINKPTILLSDKKRDKLPFDVSGFRTLFYDNTIAGKSEVEEKLKKHLENIQSL